MSQRIYREEVSITVTFTTDTSVYASADLIADTQLIGEVALKDGGIVELHSLQINDQDNQKNAMSFVFLNASTSLGTENSAPNMSDANALATQVGMVTVAATDYITAGGSSAIGSKVPNLRLQTLKPVLAPITGGVITAGSSKLWVGIVNGAGTPTYTATGLVVTFIFLR